MALAILDTVRQATEGNRAALQTLLDLYKDNKIPANEHEQIQIFLRQAAKRSHHAIYIQAMLYKYGFGTKQDPEMTFLSMREAAAKGNAMAIYEVGHFFLEGFGVNQNYSSAFQWLKTAAESPHYIKEAMQDLARMYEQGLGVEVDSEQVQFWRQQAEK